MESERNKQPQDGRRRMKRRHAAMAILALTLMAGSCGRRDEGPLPPHSPPRPTTTLFGIYLTHAHFHFPTPPRPPLRGMM